MVRSALRQASCSNAGAVCAGLACRWAGSHQAEGTPDQLRCTERLDGAAGNTQQPDTASLRGSSLEASCTGNGMRGTGTTALAFTTYNFTTHNAVGVSQSSADGGISHLDGKGAEPCVVACPEGAEVTDSSLAGSTHLLPVCKVAEPETVNVLSRNEQAVLRKGAYNFARCGNSCCLMMPVADWQTEAD